MSETNLERSGRCAAGMLTARTAISGRLHGTISGEAWSGPYQATSVRAQGGGIGRFFKNAGPRGTTSGPSPTATSSWPTTTEGMILV